MLVYRINSAKSATATHAAEQLIGKLQLSDKIRVMYYSGHNIRRPIVIKAVTSDVKCIHSKYEFVVHHAKRLTRWSLWLVYGRSGVRASPETQTITV